MNKRTFAASAVACLALAYVSGSYLLGRQVEEKYNAQLDKVLGSQPLPKVVARSYERGLLTAKSTLVLEFAVPAGALEATDKRQSPAGNDKQRSMQTVRIRIEDQVRHGPFPGMRAAAAVIETSLISIEGVEDSTRKAFGKASAPQMVTVVGLAGGYKGRALLPAGEVTFPQLRARWQALNWDFEIDPALTRIKGESRWPLFTMEVAAGDATPVQLSFEGLSARFDSQLPQDGQWLVPAGEGSGTIDKITWARTGAAGSAPTPVFSMTDVKIDSKSTRNGALLDMVQSAVGRGTLGGTPIESIRYDLALKNIDLQVLMALQTLGSTASQAEPEDAQKNAAALQQAALRLIDAKPAYRARLSALFEGQTGELGSGLALQGAPTGEAGWPAQMPPQVMLMMAAQRVDGSAALRLPKSWLPAIARGIDNPEITPVTIAAMLSTFTAQGLLAENEQAYSANIEYAAGRILVNGKPFQGVAARR